MMKSGVLKILLWVSFFRSRDIQLFVKKLKMSQTLQMTVMNHKIEIISEILE